MSRFAECLAETLKWEGGYSNDKFDPGGATMCGVIQRVYDGWRDQCHVPRRPVREIDRTEIESIYRHNYWKMVRGDELPPGIDLAVFDFGVNSGPGYSIKHLQRALCALTPTDAQPNPTRVVDDGHLGPATLSACYDAERLGRAGEVVAIIMQSRRSFLRALPTFWRFGKGWLRRCDGIEAVAGAAVFPAREVSQVTVMPWQVSTAPEPHADPDQQSAEQGRANASDVPQKTGLTEASTLTGTVSTGQLGVETATAVSRLNGRGNAWGAADLLLALAQSPVFWMALTAVIGSAYMLLRRRWQKRIA